MAEHPFKTTVRAACLVALTSSLVGAHAAEKVKFSSPSQETAVQTQPETSIQGLIPEKQQSFSGVNANVPAPQVPASNNTVQRTKPEDAERDNWIFRDTQSADGIRRALGVETYGDQGTKTKQPDATAVIEQYFARQNDRSAGSGLKADQGNPLDQLSTPGTSPATGGLSGLRNDNLFTTTDNSAADASFGSQHTGFKTTLNSPNPAIRSYYRDLYKDQISPSRSATPSLREPSGFDTVTTATDTSSRTRELFEKAARIDSMAPKSSAGVFDQTGQTKADEPVRLKQDSPLYQAPVLEQRGGKTVIPTRPF